MEFALYTLTYFYETTGNIILTLGENFFFGVTIIDRFNILLGVSNYITNMSQRYDYSFSLFLNTSL